jgi:hypothetical protein
VTLFDCCAFVGNICDQQLMIGIGESTLPRFVYSAPDDACVAFNYSGLGGNENNFLSLSGMHQISFIQQTFDILDCQRACPGQLFNEIW